MAGIIILFTVFLQLLLHLFYRTHGDSIRDKAAALLGITVSYTHLDVYKRQMLQRVRPVKRTFKRLGGKKRLYIKSIPVAFKTAMATESVT